MSHADGKVGILNFAWILFEVSEDKKGSSPAFSCVHCVLRRRTGSQVQQDWVMKVQYKADTQKISLIYF